MSSRVCSQCGCNDIDIDSARGDAVCTGCGSVLEDQIIVSEIQFQEGSGGVSSMVGQFVSTDGPKSLSLGGTFRGGLQKESRTITLQNGKKKIQHLAGQMKLNQMCVDRAFNFYKMAVSRRITRGRKLAHVVAACLYLVCRTERTPHVNVFVLGKTYLCLAKELCINMPEIDPCLYIPRFAHALEFGDKTHEVSMTAMRLVQRMKRDWMHTGRRPSGLCGAALLVAARIHDFSRTVKEIIKVVRVCQTTLKKRLMEFEDTPSSQLTIEEFQTIDLEEEHDPPSFTEGKRKLAKSKMLLEQNEKHMEEVERLQTEIDDLLVKQAPRGPWAAYAKMADDSLSIDSDVSRFSDLIEPEASRDSEKTTTSDTVSVESNCKSESHLQPDSQHDSDRTEDENPFKLETSKEAYENSNTRNDLVTNKLESSDNHSLSDNSAANRTKENSDMAKGDASSNKSVDNFSAIATELVVGSEDLVNSGETLKLPVKDGCRIPSIDMGMNEIVSDILKEGSDNSNDGQNCEGELDLEGLDDEELDRFILTEKEVLVKTKIWMEENADYLKAQKEKEERLAKEKEEEAKKPPEKKKRTYKKKPKVQYQEGQTAQEAIQKIMQEKKISSKINYDVLNDLTFNAATSKKASKNTPDAGRPAITPVGPIFKNQAISALKSKILESQSEQPSAKKMKLPTLVPEVETMKQEEVVVESGPVQYHQKDDVYEEEEEAEDYYEEEDGHLSAAQLLGHTGTEEDYYEEMD